MISTHQALSWQWMMVDVMLILERMMSPLLMMRSGENEREAQEEREDDEEVEAGEGGDAHDGGDWHHQVLQCHWDLQCWGRCVPDLSPAYPWTLQHIVNMLDQQSLSTPTNSLPVILRQERRRGEMQVLLELDLVVSKGFVTRWSSLLLNTNDSD